MKLILVLLLCTVHFVVCAQQKNAENEVLHPATVTLYEGEWITNFKNQVFIACLKKMYSEKTVKLIEAEDASTAANVDCLDFDKRIFQIVDSLANDFMKKPEASYMIENRKVTMMSVWHIETA